MNLFDDIEDLYKDDAGDVAKNVETFNGSFSGGGMAEALSALFEEDSLAHVLHPVPKSFEIVDSLPSFRRDIKRLGLRESDVADLKTQLTLNPPEACLGSCVFKFRWSPPSVNKGASVSNRVIYIELIQDSKVYLVSAFSKGDKSDLTPIELRAVRALSKKMKG